MGYKIKTVDGKLSEYAFDIGGVLALRNFKALTNGNRLIIQSQNEANFTILDALVNEVEIDGVVYDDVTSAQEALQRLVFNPTIPQILTEELRLKIINSFQKNPNGSKNKFYNEKGELVVLDLESKVDKVVGKQLSTNDYTNEEKQKLEGLVNYVLPQILANIKQTDISAWNDAKNKKITAFTITGDTNKLAKITLADGSVLQTNFVDIDTNTDVKLNSLAFDNLTGVATAVTSDGNTITASFDGRYSFINHEHEASDILGLNGYLGNLHNDILMAKQELYTYAEALCEKTKKTVDLTTLDQSKYYPVIIDITIFPKTHKITVSRDYNSSYGVPSYATHPQGFSCLLEWNCNGRKGSISPFDRTVLKVDKSNVLEVVFGDIGQMDDLSKEYVYLRGGSKYDIEVQGNSNATITLLTSNYTQLNQTLTIRDYVAEPTVTFATIRDLDKKDVKIYDVAGNFKHTYVDNKIKIGKGIKINETTGVIEVDNDLLSTKKTVDLTTLDQNKYYPVTIALTALNKTRKITVSRNLGTNYGVPSYATHSRGFSCMLEWASNGSGWGANTIMRRVISAYARYCKGLVFGGISQMDYSSLEYVYLRGGSKYDIEIQGIINARITLHTSSYTESGQTIDIKSSVDEVISSLNSIEKGSLLKHQVTIKASSHADAATKGVAIGDFYINSSTGTLTQRLS